MFRGDKYEQSGGKHSVNIQGENVTYSGLSYSDAKGIALDVFEANFYRLGQIAQEVAQERAEKIAEAYLKRLEQEAPKSLGQVQDPDIQYALFTAQREYARCGDEDIGNMLVELLVDRTKVDERNLKQLVLNEALTVLPKLNKSQINLLTLLFLVENVYFGSINSPEKLQEVLNNYIDKFRPEQIPSENQFLHLQYSSCIFIGITSDGLIDKFSSNYRGVFQKGFTLNEFKLKFPDFTDDQISELVLKCLNDSSLYQINAISEEELLQGADLLNIPANEHAELKQLFKSNTMNDEQIKEKISSLYTNFNELELLWSSTALNNSALTTVGKAIAHANLTQNTDMNPDLEIWMK